MPSWNENERVTAAMATIPRADFLPSGARFHSRVDAPIPIGHGQTNSQPTTVAIMLHLLDLKQGQRVLDVGAGSGWTTAILAELVGPNGSVIGVERHEGLIGPARTALAAHSSGQAEIRLATPGILGAPEDAPFDRILVSAEAQHLPSSLVDQLADGGVLVIPVNGVMLRVTRDGTETNITRHGQFVFVPLIED